MARVRVIPKLLIRSASFGGADRWIAIRTTGFEKQTNVGDPLSQVRILEAQDCDEYMVLFAGRHLGRDLDRWCQLVAELSDIVSSPLTVGGGISSADEARRILASGADRVCLGRQVLEDGSLLGRIADEAGSQAVVASLDFQTIEDVNESGGLFLLRDGRETDLAGLGKVLVSLERFGAGQIHIHDMDRDGSGMGLNLAVMEAASGFIPRTPTIVSGGCGSAVHFADAFMRLPSAGVAASTYFAKRNQSPLEVRAQIANAGLDLRRPFALPGIRAGR
jgi:imidazole glycerol-phosphate synthase subunit HisF